MDNFYITGIRRGLGQALADYLECVDSLEECDIFINCKHDGFSQVELLYEAGIKAHPHIYAVQKSALDKANEQLFYQGVDTCIVRFGYIDTPRVEHIDDKKMSVDYACQVIFWILRQPHRVKELTVCP